ncbi:chromate efflux transporter [Hymenobacter terrestris]|uniref:Chromate efflux transporter n=1 Tax=Hymenobacter terrestris TaxID=2748310 RepID=A0ABX2Q573_9BACT|nr:chromate efflux transporter [Hymenobacter terrestris]NVO86122.1 chromate efflux transporter [Hymenobacter terrestris]
MLAPLPRGHRRVKRGRNLVFLKDVAALGLTAFGGPQAHLAMMLRLLVDKRRYLTAPELLELMALCQILPGPSSTQTITAIGFRLGGPNLAYLTLLVWMLPAVCIMTVAGLSVSYLDKDLVMRLVQYVQPVAVGFVAYSAYTIARKVIHSKTAVGLLVLAAILVYAVQVPWVMPILLLAGGLITTFRYRKMPQQEKMPMQIEWANFVLWLGILIGAAVLGQFTQLLPVRLFENFYRNGSLVFGGGQVLAPLLYTEFVEFKHYLTSEEFLSGLGLVQALPGPNFSFAAYIGALAMRGEGSGLDGQLLGALVGAAGIFMPGTLLIFFLIRFWDQLKRYRVVKASLEGINAVSAGFVWAATFLLYHPLPDTTVNLALIGATFLLLLWDRVPSYIIVGAALAAGLVF